jgi:hypothetical protein
MTDADRCRPWHNAQVVLPLGVVQTSGYLWLNHVPLGPSHTLPMTAIDGWIPLWPWTVWPYLALVASEVVLPLFVRRREVFRRLLVAYALAMTTAFSFYLFWPTSYPRGSAPTDASWHSAAYRWLVAVDRPECCFPSGHIIVPALGCWALWRDGRRCGTWLLAAFALCAPSVLTTKQHYLWDVFGGLAVAALSLAAARWICKGYRLRGLAQAPHCRQTSQNAVRADRCCHPGP